MKKSVVIKTPIPSLEEFRVAIGLSKKDARAIEKRANVAPMKKSPVVPTDTLDDVHVPFWENRIAFADWLEDIARQVRCGDFSLPVEALVLTKDMAHFDPSIITILRWGEPTGLMSEETLREIAENSRTTT